MAVDCVDAAGDSSETYEIWDDQVDLWNGREVMIREEELMTYFVMKAQSIIQDLNEEKDIPPLSSTHDVVIFPKEEDDDDRPFEFAPCTPPDYQFAPLDPLEFALIQCGFIKKAWEATKRAAKKAAKAIKKALEQIVNIAVNAAQTIADGTKKAADKAVDFVTEHKKEVLIAVAVIAAVSGAFLLSGAAGTGAVAAGNNSKRKDDKDDDKNTSSPASPPSDPPPLPDFANDLLKSIAHEFSIDNATKESIAAIKAEAHNAWNTFGQLKTLTEQDLAHLKQVDPQFDPSSKSIETVMNTVLTDSQRQQLAKAGVTTQNWGQFIQNGHDKIDQAFSALAAHKAAISPPSTSFASSFFDKVKLGLEIIGRGMIEPELLDPNSPLDLFFKKENGNIPADLSNQTVREFVQNITATFKNEQNSLESIIASSRAQNAAKPQSNETNFSEIIDASNTHDIKKIPLKGSPVSTIYKTEGFSIVGMMILFINGMNNTFDFAMSNARHLKKFCPENLCIDGIYNHSNTFVGDALEIPVNYLGFSPNTSELIIQKCTEFHELNKENPYAKILLFCHSQGAIHTDNALSRLPKEIRDRVIVIGIAPAKVVSSDMCFKTVSYTSDKDIVHLGHLFGAFLSDAFGSFEYDEFEKYNNAKKVHSNIIVLKSHEGATGINHEFQSPTFDLIFNFYLQEYCEQKGEYR